MLDTNILSDLIRNPRGVLVERLRATDPNAVCTSIVVCWRRLKTEPPCRLKFEPGAEADFEMVGCG